MPRTRRYWDKKKTRSCVCDRNWEGIACDQRMCPRGDDPMTDCDTDVHVSDVQEIKFQTSMGLSYQTSPAFFTLKFTDLYGANFTTRPIAMLYGDYGAGAAMGDDDKSMASMFATYGAMFNTCDKIKKGGHCNVNPFVPYLCPVSCPRNPPYTLADYTGDNDDFLVPIYGFTCATLATLQLGGQSACNSRQHQIPCKTSCSTAYTGS